MKVKLYYSSSGAVVSVHLNRGTEDNPMWAGLPYNPQLKIFEPQTDIDKQLLAEAQALPEWKTLDLSDRPPTPAPSPAPNWETFRTAIMTDPAYNRIRLATLGTPADLGGTRLESMAAIALTDWELVASQWQILLSYALPQDRPSIEEIEQWQQIADSAAMPFDFSESGAITLPDGRSIEPFKVDPASLQMASNVDAYFQDSGKNIQTVLEKTIIKIDGLHPDSFSEFSWKIWDAATSKIHPVKVGGKYTARVTFTAICEAPTVLQIALDAVDFTIPAEPVQPFNLGESRKAVTISFFIRKNFISSGLKLCISASAPTQIKDAGLYLVRLAG